MGGLGEALPTRPCETAPRRGRAGRGEGGAPPQNLTKKISGVLKKSHPKKLSEASPGCLRAPRRPAPAPDKKQILGGAPDKKITPDKKISGHEARAGWRQRHRRGGRMDTGRAGIVLGRKSLKFQWFFNDFWKNQEKTTEKAMVFR